jgi:hypothetical protein
MLMFFSIQLFEAHFSVQSVHDKPNKSKLSAYGVRCSTNDCFCGGRSVSSMFLLQLGTAFVRDQKSKRNDPFAQFEAQVTPRYPLLNPRGKEGTRVGANETRLCELWLAPTQAFPHYHTWFRNGYSRREAIGLKRAYCEDQRVF